MLKPHLLHQLKPNTVEKILAALNVAFIHDRKRKQAFQVKLQSG